MFQTLPKCDISIVKGLFKVENALYSNDQKHIINYLQARQKI